jgi:hypothetical protein
LAFVTPPDRIKPNAIRIARVLAACQAIEYRLAQQSGSAVLDIFARALILDIFASCRRQPQNFIEFPVE